MAKRIVPNGELRGNLEFDEVEFQQNMRIDGNLKARRVICMGTLEVTGELVCDELECPSGRAPIARRTVIGGVDSGEAAFEPMQAPPPELEDFGDEDWGEEPAEDAGDPQPPQEASEEARQADPVLRAAAIPAGSDPVLAAA